MTTTATTRSRFNTYRGLGNSCPICTSTSGKCRWQPYELSACNGKITSTTKTLCMTGSGGIGHPDYHYFNDTRDRNWGIYIPLADWNVHRGENAAATAEQRERWIREQQEKQAALLALENQRRADSLPPTERDVAARAILSQLSLTEIDRQDLLGRGFTPHQIRTIGFKSVEKWQRLKEPVNNRFPGVSISSFKLNNGIAGVLIPIYSITGEILGFQIRNRDREDENRYRWLSSTWEKGRDNGAAPALPNGENPLTFVYPQLLGELGIMGVRNTLRLHTPAACELPNSPHRIGLVEGTGAKPHLAAIKMGQQIIGAAGGQWLSSPELLKDGLERWRAETIDLYLDGDDLQKNPSYPAVARPLLSIKPVGLSAALDAIGVRY